MASSRGAGDDDDGAGGRGASRERFAHAKAVFCAALDQSPAERRAFVVRACDGDAGLRLEVESLLASDEGADSFIEVPAAALTPLASGPDVCAAVPPGREGGGSDRAPQFVSGARLGPYLIEVLLGSGGMGEVYRALDTRLRRRVAIKIVSAAETDAKGRAALLREARHASVLSHPGICTVYEVSEAEGRPFIVLEYVEGETLRSAIDRAGGLAPATVLRHGASVADALEHAHRHGVIHRDLKSANVMVADDGRVKVLDFGLARWAPEAAELQASATLTTQALGLAGTLHCMAPELLGGARADARSDVWSLGVLLFEMVSGRRPFSGQTAFDTASAIMRAGAPVFPPRVPLGLRLVIGKCLSRDPARRYQSAADVGAALAALQGRGRGRVVARLAADKVKARVVTSVVAATVLAAALVLTGGDSGARHAAGARLQPMRALVVLPLEDAAGGGADRYFVEGITEALIAEAGKAGVNRVISRTTAMLFRGAPKTPTAVARELGVDAVVEGSVTRTSGRVRLSLRLLDGSNGRLVWSAVEQRDEREVLALVSRAARGIAAAMRYAMTEARERRLAAVRAVDPVVYEAYLKGRYYWNERTTASLQRAIGYYKEAIARDPTYAPAHASLADCYNQLGTVMVSTGSPGTFRPLAEGSTIKALQIDPEFAEAHATLGYIRHYEWRWADAEREFVRSIDLNPGNPLAHIWYANMLLSQCRFPEALREVELARDLDPFSLVVNTNVGWTLAYAGRHGEAVAQYHRVLDLDPGYVQAHMRLAGALESLGRTAEAIGEHEEVVRLTGGDVIGLAGLAEAYARAGRLPQARALLRQLLDDSRRRYVAPAAVAEIYEQLGDVDAAFEWFEKAYSEHSNKIAYLGVEPHPRLRADPRYAALLRRAGLE